MARSRMGDEPLVSVIMIFLNGESFIEEAIESVFAQTYTNWELLLVDDGSTDASTAIARRVAEAAPARARYLEHPGHANRGMSAARNLGIREARGAYIAFLDADDVWLPEKLEQQIAILRSQPEAEMVYGPTQWWFSWTGKPEDRERDFVHELGVPPDTLIKPPRLLALFLEHEGISPCTCSLLVRREAVERVGGFEEWFPGMYEDQAFYAKICLHSPVYASGGCWYRYRQHPDSACSVAERTGLASSTRLRFLDWLRSYLLDQGVTDPAVWQALQRELLRARHQTLYRGVRRTERFLRRTVRPWYRSARARARRALSLPILRHVRWLQLRRLDPLGNGRQVGTPVVRFYWSAYLRRHHADIRGKALEVGTTATIREYGGQALTCADAIDVTAHSPEITVVADLARADHLPSDTYDCFVNQFTMHLIYDVEAALYHSIRMLKPGGVLLINFSSLDYYFPRGLDMGTGKPLFVYWWFTPIQVENLLRRAGLSDGDYELTVYGNLMTRVAYQLNMPVEELARHEREHIDPGHPLLICVRVVKPSDWQASRPEYRDPWTPDLPPARWNPVTGHYAS